MITIKINEKGLVKYISGISSFINAVNHRKGILDELKKEQAERWVQNFNSQGNEYEPWQETSEAYQERRVQKGNPPQPTLHETGRLLDVVTDQSNKGKVTNSAVEWNMRNAYGTAYPVSHQTGYVLKGSTIPARLLWDLDDEDEQRGQEKFEQWLEEQALLHLG